MLLNNASSDGDLNARAAQSTVIGQQTMNFLWILVFEHEARGS